MTQHVHPLIADYLRRFDIAAGRVAEPRRAALREEIAAHLGEAIPAGASDAEARAIIEEFGSPEDIIGQEGVEPVRRNWKPTIIAAAALVVIAVAAGVINVVTYEPPYPTGVVSDPEGPVRIERGRSFLEYRAAIARMEYPLPEGAEYPTGVVFTKYDELDDDGNAAEPIGGGTIAHFTWLCAWESQYLYALSDGNTARQAEAEDMITAWSKSDFYLSLSDPDGNFVTQVVAPMKLGNSAGVSDNMRTSCDIAGITPR